MRLRLLKLLCIVLVLALAGGLIVFNFANDDLQSAFIETSSVTPATGIDTGAETPANPSGRGAAPDQSAAAAPPLAAASPASDGPASAHPTSGAQTQTGYGQGAAFAPIVPSANEMSQSPSGPAAVAPGPASTEAASAPSSTAAPADAGSATPAPATKTAQAAPPPAAAPTQPAASTVATTAAAAPPAGPAGTAAPTTEAAAPQAADSPPDRVASAGTSGSSYAGVVWPEGQPSQVTGSEAAAAPKPQSEASVALPPRVTHHHAVKERAATRAAPLQPAEKTAATARQSVTTPLASGATPALAPSLPAHDLVAQVVPPRAPAKAPLAPLATPMPSKRKSDFAAHLSVGPQVLIEFPSLQSKASGSLAGSGSVTNSSTRVIPGIVGSWTSAPLADLPLKPSFGGSLFVGAPASGDSVASATTSGGYTLKLGQTNDWPVIMPRFFMGLPVADGTRASVGTGVWVDNVKETATLANASGSQSDARSGVMMRPFLSAAIEQHAPLLGFLPSESQRLKVSGGYIFGDSTFSAPFCAAGQTCVRTQDQGSWFLGLSFQMGFPAGGAR